MQTQTQIALRLSQDVVGRAEELIEMLTEDAEVRATVGKVTRSTVLRLAIEKGLSALEQEREAKEKEPKPEPVSRKAKSGKVEFQVARTSFDAQETEQEILDKIQHIVRRSRRRRTVKYVQYHRTARYFVTQGERFTRWFVRANCRGKKLRLTTRLDIDEVRELAPGFKVSSRDGYTRVDFTSVSELDALAELVLRCYESELDSFDKS